MRVSKRSRELYQMFYKGSFGSAVIGHSKDDTLRGKCASGGLVSSLLINRLESGSIDGALVAGLRYGDSDIPLPETVIARSKEELISRSGSVYTDFDHFQGIKRILNDQDGIYDVVVLPCQARTIRRAMEADVAFTRRVGLLIGLWCGHATGIELLESLFMKWKIVTSAVSSFRYRVGHWRGKTKIELRDGSTIEKSFSKEFGLYQNMYADCAVRCFSCNDHFAESCDISFGDCWIRAQKDKPIKETIGISFTDEGDEAVNLLLENNLSEVTAIDPALAVESQKRAVIWHTYSRSARSKMQKLFSISVSDKGGPAPRVIDYGSAFLTLFYNYLFKSRMRNFMFRLPWWVLFPAMAFQKLLLNR